MRIVKSILTVLLGILLLVVLISFFLPSQVHVERTGLVKNSPHVTYKLINSLPEWEKWSPWHQIDPNMKIEYGTPREGKGGWYSWKSEHSNVGNGKLTITDARPVEYIKTEMDFMENGKGSAEFFLRPVEGGTEVKWTMDSDMGWNPIGKIMGLFMDKLIGPDYEKGLKQLDSVARSQPAETHSVILEMGKSPAMKILYIARKTTEAGLGSALGECHAKIMEEIGKNGLQIAGPPLAFYEEPKDGIYTFEAGIPVNAFPAGKPAGEIQWRDSPEMMAAICHFSGPYEQTAKAYPALMELIQQQGKVPAANPYERYLVDPAKVSHPLEIKTDIIWMVK